MASINLVEDSRISHSPVLTGCQPSSGTVHTENQPPSDAFPRSAASVYQPRGYCHLLSPKRRALLPPPTQSTNNTQRKRDRKREKERERERTRPDADDGRSPAESSRLHDVIQRADKPHIRAPGQTERLRTGPGQPQQDPEEVIVRRGSQHGSRWLWWLWIRRAASAGKP